MKKFAAFAWSLAIAASLVGCSRSDTSSSTTSGDTSSDTTTEETTSDDAKTESGAKSVAFSKENDVVSMDTSKATDGMSFEMQSATIEGLLTVDADENIIGAAADTWEASEDGMTWTFHIRDDASWNNGTPVTANDFVFAWNRAVKDAENEYAYLFGDQGAQVKNGQEIIDAMANGEDVDDMSLGITAEDDKTLVVELSTNNALFEWLTTFPINEDFYNEQGSNYALTPDALLASGPYQLVSWEKDSKIVLQKNESYWDADNVDVDELVFNIIKDANSAALAYESGDLDFATINGTLIDKYQDNDDLYNYLQGYLWYMQFNTTNEYLSNLNLRKALALAIDRQDLAENVLKDGFQSVDGFMPSGLAFSPDGVDYREENGSYFGDDAAANLAEAQELFDKALEELGVDSITLELLYETSYPADEAAQFMQSQLAQLNGLTITMNGQEKSNRLDLQKSRDFDIVLNRWGPDYADPTTYLNLLTSSQTFAESDGGMNYSEWCNHDYDALLEEAASGIDISERWDLLLQAEKLIMEDVPVTGVFQVAGVALKNPKLTGIETHEAGVTFRYKNLKLED